MNITFTSRSHKIQVVPVLYLLSSKFEWILTGRRNEINNDQDDMSMVIMTHGKLLTEMKCFPVLINP